MVIHHLGPACILVSEQSLVTHVQFNLVYFQRVDQINMRFWRYDFLLGRACGAVNVAV